MNTQLTRIDDVIRYQIGSIIIALQWVATGAYTVVTTRGGIARIEDNCGSYRTEAEARAVARLYAQMYKAEARDAEVVAGVNANMDEVAARRDATQLTEAAREIVADGQGWNAYRQSCTRRAAKTSEPLDRVLAQADHNGYIRRGKTARVDQLNALERCGLVKLDRRKQGRHWVTFGATLTAKAEKLAVAA